MNRFALFAFFLSLTACEKRDLPQPQITFDLTEPAFLEFPATSTLEAIGSISADSHHRVLVEFNLQDGRSLFVCSTEEVFYEIGIHFEPPHIQLRYDGIAFNDEELTLIEAEKRVAKYMEAARMTHSNPVFMISASSGSTNSRLAQVLGILAGHDIVQLLIEPREKAVVANPPPPRVGKPYEIQPEDLFQTGAP